MKSKFKYYLLPIIYVILIYTLILIFGYTSQRIITSNQNHYESSVSDEISRDLKLRLNEYVSKIEAMEEFANKSKVLGINYDDFYLFSSGLFQNDDSLEAIIISPNAVHEFVYPIEYDEIIGHDLFNDEREFVVEDVTQAINNNEIVVSGPYSNRVDPSVNIVVIRNPLYFDDGEFFALINVVVRTSIFFEPHISSQYDDIVFNIYDAEGAILYGSEFEYPIKNIEAIPLNYFGWDIQFGRSQDYSNSTLSKNRIVEIIFYSVSVIFLISGIFLVKATVKSKIERDKKTNEIKFEKELTQKYLDELLLAGNLFENSIQNAPIPIMIHAEDGDVLHISQTWSDLTNYSLEDIPTIFDWTQKAYGQSKEDVREVIRKLYYLTEKQHDGEFIVTTKDGRDIVWDFYSVSLGKLPDGRAVAMSIATDITNRIERENKISYLSYKDQLTGLYNRRFFEEQLRRLDNPRNMPLSIIIGDVNGLKLINDAFGHKAGDKLLKLIGDLISSSIRGNDIASRWGGDEFAVILPNSDANAAEVLVNRIQEKIGKSAFEYGRLSISFGIETKKANENINDIFRSAEKLMYQNKLSEIDSVRGETINIILTTLFEKSFEIKEHSTRVSELAVSIAQEMKMSKSKIKDIKTIGMIHDIGKIVIDLQVLNKPDKLTNEERENIQQHPLSGSRMLTSSHEYSRLAVGVLHHHEHIDGKGYPIGIKGDQIPIESKIIAVADAYDAMTAIRPYRLKPLTKAEAIAELQKYSGTQFDKEVVDIFINKVISNKVI